MNTTTQPHTFFFYAGDVVCSLVFYQEIYDGDSSHLRLHYLDRAQLQISQWDLNLLGQQYLIVSLQYLQYLYDIYSTCIMFYSIYSISMLYMLLYSTCMISILYMLLYYTQDVTYMVLIMFCVYFLHICIHINYKWDTLSLSSA